ncbi:MAG: hypothetical protein LH467_16770 [Gemmatimonadaceae bacterium]|nr:hypothetical protein [Gemmatimonadaceae bacterium]
MSRRSVIRFAAALVLVAPGTTYAQQANDSAYTARIRELTPTTPRHHG